MYSRILCCASERFFNIPNPTKLGRTGLQESDPRKATEIMMLSMESRLNSSGTYSQDSQRCSSVIKSMIFWAIWDKHQQLSQEEFYLCQCSMTSPVTEKTTKMNVYEMPNLWRYFQEDLVLGNGHLLDQVLKRSGILPRTVHKELGTTLRSKCCWNLQKVGILFIRATTPLSRCNLKSKGRGKLSIHLAADQDTIDTIYRIILSVNQLSVYGAVAAVCEEFEGHQDRSGEPEIMMGQSIVLGTRNSFAQRKSHEWPNYLAAVHSTSWIAFTRKQS